MNCKNCNSSLIDSNNFCENCGAKIIRNRLTLKNLFEHFSEQFLNYDNKFLQTFIHLFTKPEAVIGCYIDGTRKKYVNVISYFAIAITISGLQIFILNKFYPESIISDTFNAQGTQDFSKEIMGFSLEYQSLVLMFTVPIYAILGKLIFLKNKKYNYTELLVIFMYILAQTSIIGALIAIGGVVFGSSLGNISIILLPLQVLYSAYCLKRLYKLTLKEIILKTFLFMFISGFLYILTTILIFTTLYLTDNQWFLELIKKQTELQKQ